MPVPRGPRATREVVPKLGVKAGFPALRIGAVAKYDLPLEHLCGDLDIAQLNLYATRYVRQRRPAKV